MLSRLEPRNADACKPAQILLEDFVWPSVDCVVAKSEIIVQEQVLSMDNAYRLVQTAFDVDAVLWYQESVVAAVVKAVLAEILCGIRRDGLKYVQPYISLINGVYALVAPAGRHRRRDLPDCLIDGFTILNAFSQYASPLDELQRYHDTLTGLRLPTPFERSLERREFLLVAFAKLAEHLQPDVGSFECFGRRSYECLRDRRDRYHYEPSAAVAVAAMVTAATSGESEGNDQNVCDYLAIVHSTCRPMYVSLLADVYGRKNTEKAGKAFHSNFRLLDDVRQYIQPIIDKRTRDARLLRLTYDVAAILANIPRRRSDSKSRFYVTDAQRYLNVIVSALGFAVVLPSSRRIGHVSMVVRQRRRRRRCGGTAAANTARVLPP